MKKLSVTIQVEFEIPESWELVLHPDNIQAIKVSEECYMDMSYLPMLTTHLTEGAQWSSECSYEFSSELMNMIKNEEVSMKLEG